MTERSGSREYLSMALDVLGEATVPRSLGKYEILRALATGGMAEIFVGRAHGIEGFEKVVVIKRLRPEVSADPQFVNMFMDEARVLSGLQHSNIVQIYDVGSSDGCFFFAMELLRGEDVRSIVKRVRRTSSSLPLEHAVFITMSLLAGLHYAHQKCSPDGVPLGIVHRDVSPSNVFVTYDGDVKVIDFGIAKTTIQSAQTRFGVVKGKIRYMSPEQCTSRAIDRRSDIFSAAIVLWELTTGRRLFSGSDYDIMKQIIETDAPPPSRFLPDCPPELERILVKGLQRDADERYSTAQEMQADLDAFAREQRLSASSLALGRFMSDVFADRIEAWGAAERSSRGFASHVGEVLEASHITGTPSRQGSGSSGGASPPTGKRAAPTTEVLDLVPEPVAASKPADFDTAAPTTLDRARPRPRSSATYLGGGVLLAAVAGAGVWTLLTRASPPRAPSSAATLELSAQPVSAGGPATPPGATIAAPAATEAPAPTTSVGVPGVAASTPTPVKPASPSRRTAPVVAPVAPATRAPKASAWDKDSPLLPP